MIFDSLYPEQAIAANGRGREWVLTNRLDDNCPPALARSQELLPVREAHCPVPDSHQEPVTPLV